MHVRPLGARPTPLDHSFSSTFHLSFRDTLQIVTFQKTLLLTTNGFVASLVFFISALTRPLITAYFSC